MAYKIAVVGAGMFGTAMANIAGENGYSVSLWARDEEQVKSMIETGENAKYLPGYPLHSRIRPSGNLHETLHGARIVFMSVPSSSIREVARMAASSIESGAMVISTTKGVEPDGFYLMSEVLGEELSGVSIGVLSGPNLAEEIMQKQITATVIASKSTDLIETVQKILHTSYFRLYSSDDVYGVELAGALKNVYAIAAGFAAALGVGSNTMGVLVTRSLAEMSRFAHAMGARPMTFMGLAGIGDLLVTCTSPLSRNYQIGYLIGQGLNLDAAQSRLGKLAEGVNTVRILKSKAAEMEVYMPLVNGLYDILFTSRSVDEVIYEMMMAEQPSDVEFVT